MSDVGLVLDLGYLGIAGFGVWRGQTLWSHHIELKHEREMMRLNMDRTERSVRLEMEQTRNLAEISKMAEMPALPPGEGIVDLAELPLVCGCAEHASFHLHLLHKGGQMAMPLSIGALDAIRERNFSHLCVCKERSGSCAIHVHGDDPAYVSLNSRGWTVRK